MPGKGRSHRLRAGRYSELGRIYLVTIVCHGRAPLFADWKTGRCFVHSLREVAGLATTLCYVVMPDHVHWLIQLDGCNNLSMVVRKAKSLTTRALHERDPGIGRVWMPGFHDRALRKGEDLKAAARYVVANPLRAGLVASIGDYPLWDAVWL